MLSQALIDCARRSLAKRRDCRDARSPLTDWHFRRQPVQAAAVKPSMSSVLKTRGHALEKKVRGCSFLRVMPSDVTPAHPLDRHTKESSETLCRKPRSSAQKQNQRRQSRPANVRAAFGYIDRLVLAASMRGLPGVDALKMLSGSSTSSVHCAGRKMTPSGSGKTSSLASDYIRDPLPSGVG